MSKKTIGITIIGDSIIRHKKNNVIYDWSAELKKEISKKFKFIFYFKVKSVVGINSENLLKLLSKSFTKNKKKDILIFQIGINDSWHYKSRKGIPCVSLNDFEKNLKKIYLKAKIKKFKKIIFLNYHKLLNNRIEINNKTLNENLDKYNKKIRFFCKKYKLDLIDINRLTKNQNLCLKLPDGIHLNKNGVKIYSSIILKFITKSINEKKI